MNKLGFLLILITQILGCSLAFSVSEENINVENLFEEYYSKADSSNTPNVSLNYAKKALEIAIELNDQSKIAKSYFQIGHSYKLLGNLTEALDYLLKSSRIYDRLDNQTNLASCYNAIANVYIVQENFLQAVGFFYRAIRINKSLGDKFNLAGDYNNIGETYRLWGDLDSAFVYFDRSNRLYSELKFDLGIAYSLGNIGLVHAELSQNDSAEYYIQRATEILEELGDRYPIAVYETYMADIYKDKGDWDKALEYAKNSLKIAKEEGLKEQIRDASLKLSELYHGMGDFESAFLFQEQYIAFRDSINNEDVIRKMADLRMEYEISKKQAEVDLLQQKRENQRLISWALVSTLMLISVLTFFTFRNNRARKKTNKLLSDQKEEIEIQRDRLNDLIKMKDKFFGIISHDLRSPVNSLQSITHLLKHYVETKNTGELEQMTVLIEKSVGNLSSLLDNLLNWALTQQGALPYDPKEVNLNHLVENVLDIFKNASQAKSIELTTEIPGDIAVWVDEDSTHSLLRNIVNNAIKFTPENGKVKINAHKNMKHVDLTVSDTGVGMDKFQLQKLFKMDKKKINRGTYGEKGSGLGMMLCREIVKLNNGKITAESAKGEGTTIYLELPVA